MNQGVLTTRSRGESEAIKQNPHSEQSSADSDDLIAGQLRFGLQMGNRTPFFCSSRGRSTATRTFQQLGSSGGLGTGGLVCRRVCGFAPWSPCTVERKKKKMLQGCNVPCCWMSAPCCGASRDGDVSARHSGPWLGYPAPSRDRVGYGIDM